jgi:hypothetical protein
MFVKKYITLFCVIVWSLRVLGMEHSQINFVWSGKSEEWPAYVEKWKQHNFDTWIEADRHLFSTVLCEGLYSKYWILNHYMTAQKTEEIKKDLEAWHAKKQDVKFVPIFGAIRQQLTKDQDLDEPIKMARTVIDLLKGKDYEPFYVSSAKLTAASVQLNISLAELKQDCSPS